MTKIKTRPWDTVEHLKTEDDIALYLEACFEEAGDDAAFIAKALGKIGRARGMTQLARDTGLGHEGVVGARQSEPKYGAERSSCARREADGRSHLTRTLTSSRT